MDKRRSFYLASRQDDFGEPPVDKGWVADIPYVMPANDDVRTKERLSAQCGVFASSFDRPASPEFTDPLVRRHTMSRIGSKPEVP
jgi:hypothetical protein